MPRNYFFTAAATLCVVLSPFCLSRCCAQEPQQIVIENFASDPAARDWQSFGERDLLRWNPSSENLDVTWDSSRPNSFLRLPLGTIMTRRDDFDVALDLFLDDFAAGVDPAKSGTFQLAFGFQNFADAARPDFFRAAPNAAPNLVEFNFFPDSGFGATIWPAVMSTNGAMNYSGASDFSVFDLPVGVWMRISLAYRSSNETATITISAGGDLVGPITTARLATNDVAFGKKFTDFNVDTFAVASYSDEGQSGPFAGSLLAHGTIDNVVIAFPPPPIRNFGGRFEGDGWRGEFLSRTNWTYRLEASANLVSWDQLGNDIAGTGATIAVSDPLPRPASFYRVAAQPTN